MILPKGLGLMWQCSGARARRYMAAGIGFRFLQSATLGAAFAVVLVILDDGHMTTIRAWQVTVVMAILLAAHMTFAYLSLRMAWIGAFRAGAQMRHALLNHLVRLPIGFHTSRRRGDTVSAITSDVQMIENFFSDALPQIAQALGMPLVILCFLFVRDPALAATAAVVIVVAVPFLFLTARTIARLGLIRQERQAEAASAIIEYVRGLVVIRALNRVSSAQSGAQTALTTFRDVSNTLVDRIVWPMVSVGGLLMAGVPLVIFAASLQMDTVSPMTLMAFLVLLLSLYAPLSAILSVMELARITEAAFARTCRIFDAAPLPEPRTPVMPETFDLRFVDVHCPVLGGIDFYAPQRTITALIGPSGAGKTTILNLAARFGDVDRGRILIGGVDVRDIGWRNLMNCIGVVHQDGWIFSGTIRENITMARPDATREQMETAARAAQAHEFITALPNGYDTIVSEDGETLSGGERQRIAIARAILKDAPIILLDEVTSAIDATHERAITQALTTLAKDKTVLIVAHKVSTIAHAGQIIVLRDGKIVRHDQP